MAFFGRTQHHLGFSEPEKFFPRTGSNVLSSFHPVRTIWGLSSLLRLLEDFEPLFGQNLLHIYSGYVLLRLLYI
jgi:hypothetical protein